MASQLCQVIHAEFSSYIQFIAFSKQSQSKASKITQASMAWLRVLPFSIPKQHEVDRSDLIMFSLPHSVKISAAEDTQFTLRKKKSSLL